MKKFLYIAIFSSLLFGGECVKDFLFQETSDSYKIHVFDYIAPSEELDLSLEAKMYLLINLKKINHKKFYGLKIKNFQEIESYKCENTLQASYEVKKDGIEYIYQKEDMDDNVISYRDTRKSILWKIGLIEAKDNLTLEDYKRLYIFYLSLGKVEDANSVMDKIIKLKWEE